MATYRVPLTNKVSGEMTSIFVDAENGDIARELAAGRNPEFAVGPPKIELPPMGATVIRSSGAVVSGQLGATGLTKSDLVKIVSDGTFAALKRFYWWLLLTACLIVGVTVGLVALLASVVRH